MKHHSQEIHCCEDDFDQFGYSNYQDSKYCVICDYTFVQKDLPNSRPYNLKVNFFKEKEILYIRSGFRDLKSNQKPTRAPPIA